MTSVSLVDWKMEPSSSRRRRSSAALTRLPLWATAIAAARVVDGERLGVAQAEPPAVE